MRWWLVPMLAGFVQAAWGQGLLINEVLPSPNDEKDLPEGVEVYNPTARAIDLKGYRFVMQGSWHEVQAHTLVPAKGLFVLWGERDSTASIDLRLPRHGGTLLLIDPDGRKVRDVFSWAELPRGVSIGRMTDGGHEWGYFDEPTLARANATAVAHRRILHAPAITVTDGMWTVEKEEGTTVRFTTDGSLPDAGSPVYDGPGPVAHGSIITARSFARDARASEAASHTCVMNEQEAALALRIDPHEWTDTSGIFTASDRANYARRGKAWQRLGYLEMLDSTEREGRPVGLSIAGSGSRSRAKKNVKLMARSRFGADAPIRIKGLAPSDEVLLRADATPHAFLRGAFIEHVVHAAGDRVDVQPSVSLPLYVNGSYAGLYRAMPTKSPEWLRSLCGQPAVDVIEGPAAREVCGRNDDFKSMLDLLLQNGNVDSLSQKADIQSLIELACLDLYMGRADHELNVRAWRPAKSDGRWRWVLYDVDLWSPPNENGVLRMCTATMPETPYLPQLLDGPALRDQLLARMSAMLATLLDPQHAAVFAEELFDANKAAMQRDFEHWGSELDLPSPEDCLSTLREHIDARPVALLRHLAEHTHTTLHVVQVAVEPEGSGQVFVEDLPLADNARFQRFGDVPLHLLAVPAEGMEFVGWKGLNDPRASIVLNDANTHRLRAVFRKKGSGQNGL